MKSLPRKIRYTFMLVMCGALASGQLIAANADEDKQKSQKEQERAGHSMKKHHFDNGHKQLVRTYFQEESRHGRCPPGLAKKNNGCNPPGLVKRWQLGQSLNQNVTYYSLPGNLDLLLGQPQPGYHYGMVDSDILLLVDGTEMVIDAITNLGL